MTSVHLVNGGVQEDSFALIQGILMRQLAARGCCLAEDGLAVVLRCDERLESDEYLIEGDAIASGSQLGLIAGLGRYLRDGQFDGCGQFVPGGKPVHLKMKKAVRGMYLASHFFNFYHAAPIEEVYDLMDSLALRGCNAIMAWFDMHHYTGMDDPAAVQMIGRLQMIYRYAQRLGMKQCATMLANEAFAGTDDRIKADWRAVNGYKSAPVGHFHVEICPSAAGGMEEIIRQRRQVLSAFRETPFDYISFWPYDQGGCTCEKCAPWGANGFLKIAPEFRRVVEEEMPGARILCGTWRFSAFIDGEWEAFHERMKEEQFSFFSHLIDDLPEWEHMPELLKRGDVPGDKRFLAFQEISMFGAVPWGGFGVSGIPARLEKRERENGHCYDGGFPYSEGIFEDVNKAVTLGFATGQYESAREALSDYVRYEFCVEEAEEIVSILYDMEETLPRMRYDQNGIWQDYLRCEMPADTVYHFEFECPEKIDSIYHRALAANAALTEPARKGWRWRIILLRAIIDYELYHNDGVSTLRCEECYRELTALYHAEKADYCVAPPTEEAMRLNRGGFLL